ncbi:ATP-binding protein [Pseudazoarcus pumilus]|uniref:histidine kinase n=1 Tax=Pseudazoarcus pumilus TaxID=2067960 RepID=A0A2I6S388_9RHOO|nr:ATP-binding protein [Pseudazoarcus pumilus]AUN93730.1 hypothetical protein C0099_01530 [Pseudazoarcus pumilus]
MTGPRCLVAAVVCCCIALWAPIAAAGHACAPTILDDSAHFGVKDFGRSVRLAKAPPDADVQDIARLPETAFSPPPRGGIVAGGGAPVWLRLCLQREASAAPEWALIVLPAYIRQITLFEPDGAAFRARIKDRDRQRDDSDVAYRGAAFALQPDVETPSAYYMKIDGPRPVAVDLLLLEQGRISHFVAIEYAGYGLYLGMMLLVATINLIFWHRLRDPLHLRYALAILSVALFGLVIGGYLEQFVPAFAAYYDRTWMTAYAICAALMIRFVLDAFRTRLYYPMLYRAGRMMIALLAIFVCISVLGIDPGFDAARLIRYLGLASILVFGLTSLHALLHHRSVRLYAIAFLPLIAGLLSITARRFGLADVPLADHLPNIGALVHVVLLNFALARRAERADRARQRAQQSALRAAQTSERMLEARVVERTRALDLVNAQLHREISERTAAQERLHEALEAERRALHGQRQFVAMLSHELRTPLAVIDTAAQGLADEQADSQRPRRIERIRRSVGRLVGFIENLLAEDRIASPSRMHMRRHDLRAALQQHYGDVADGRVRTTLPDDPVEVFVDPDLIGIVVSNLVDNALKYSPKDTPVDVILRHAGDGVVLDVVDQGHGIPADDRERVFEKYYRAHGGLERQGAGLGLYLCREIARRHGGDIELLAPTDEVGTTARLRLPVAPADDALRPDAT